MLEPAPPSPTDAKPDCLAKLEKPPPEGMAVAVLPKGLWLFPPLAKPEKPPCELPHGDVLMPTCDAWPKPTALGLPNAGAADGVLPKELEPNVAPPVLDGVLAAEAPHGDVLCPS